MGDTGGAEVGERHEPVAVPLGVVEHYWDLISWMEEKEGILYQGSEGVSIELVEGVRRKSIPLSDKR